MGSIIYKYLSDFRYSTDFYYVDISPPERQSDNTALIKESNK